MGSISAKTVLQRAYSVIEVKSFDQETRTITGRATSPTPDRMGDIVDPFGASFANPLPLLLHHDSTLPVGTASFGVPSRDGIDFTAKFPVIAEDGKLKERVDGAWQSVKAGLIRGVSIGFRAMDDGVERLKSGGLKFLKTEILELSLVVVPANADAVISTIKSIDTSDRAALGRGVEGDTSTSAGVTAPIVPARKGALKTMKTITEQISAFEATRQAKAARRSDIMTTASDNGVTLDAAQTEEYDRLDGEIKSLDDHLTRLAALEAENKKSAVAVDGRTPVAAAASRNSVIQIKDNLPKGTAFTRYVMALAVGRGSRLEAAEFAKRWDKSTPEVAMILKTASDAGTTTDSTWAGPLVVYQNMASEFIELLRPATILGKISGFRRVPFNISMPRQTSGSTVGWVGQGKPKPVGELAFDQVTLGMAKAAGIIVIAEELARSSNPSAEAIIQQDLRDTMAYFLDRQFVDPAVAEVSNVSPAAVTNGASVIDSTGVTAAFLRADFGSALAVWTAAGLSISGGVVLMTETQAIRLSMVVNAFGQAEFPGLTATGGSIFGLPVITSENIPAEGGSPAGNRIILLKPGEILLADDGGVAIDVSREASVQMNTTPDDPATASTVQVSFWQNNLVGIRAERFINWKKRRSAAAVIIEGALYTG